MTARFGTGLALFCTMVLGCDDADGEDQCDMPTISVEAASDTVAAGGDITLRISVENFTLQDPDGGHDHHGSIEDEQNRDAYEGACSGHYHVYLDSLEVDPLLMEWNDEVEVTIPAATQAGAHELHVRLNDDGHKIIKPEVVDSVDITVE